MTIDEKPIRFKIEPPVEIRERRLGSITTWSGLAGDLVERSRAGALREGSRSFEQVAACASGCATLNLVTIDDAVVVNHAPMGCAGVAARYNRCRRIGRTKRGLAPDNLPLVSTDVRERDTILGATGKLVETIRAAVAERKPAAVFVTTSCASGIIGEDIEGAIAEAEAELGIPVVQVDCAGFKSRIWANGFDAAYDALLRRIVKPATARDPNRVNVVCFSGSLGPLEELLSPLGLVPEPITQFKTIAEIERLSEAAATVGVCPTLSSWLADGLEQRFGVPRVQAPSPYGLRATDAWLRGLGAVTKRSDRAEDFIAAEHAAIKPELDELRTKLAGKRVFVSAGSAQGHNFIAALNDLGIRLAGGCSSHHDPSLDHLAPEADSLANAIHERPDVPYGVCNKQAYQLMNMIHRLKPDLAIMRHPGLVFWPAKLGIPTAYFEDEHFGLGYRGLIRLGRAILDRLDNPALERSLARRAHLPFTDWWLEREATHFLEF